MMQTKKPYTVSIEEAPKEAVTVDITYDVKDTDTGEVSQETKTVTIEAGKKSVEFKVSNVDDNIKENDEVYNVGIANPTDGGFEKVVVSL